MCVFLRYRCSAHVVCFPLQTSYCEEQLQTQVAGMRQQVHARRSSMHAHVQQLSLLREEVGSNVSIVNRGIEQC